MSKDIVKLQRTDVTRTDVTRNDDDITQIPYMELLRRIEALRPEAYRYARRTVGIHPVFYTLTQEAQSRSQVAKLTADIVEERLRRRLYEEETDTGYAKLDRMCIDAFNDLESGYLPPRPIRSKS